MAETPNHTPMTVPVPTQSAVVSTALPIDPTAASSFRAERIKSLSQLWAHAHGAMYFVETTRVTEAPATSLPATLLAPVSAEHCAIGAAAAREISDELGWDARWGLLDVVIVARYEDAKSEVVTSTGFDFYAKLAERLGPGLFQALAFDIVTGAE